MKYHENYYHQNDVIKLGKLLTSKTEIQHILRAWAAISLAFAIMLSGTHFSDLFSFNFSQRFLYTLLTAAITVGLGFLLHELGHKIVAQHYRCWAEFRADNQMLALAVIMSFLGFIFAAPGAVMIAGNVNARKNGLISAAGPLVNLALAMIFLLLIFIFPVAGLLGISYYGFIINSWLGLFNMLPFGNFDGAKIFRWNKFVFGTMIGIAILLMVAQNFLFRI
ncbi:hypothetical protein J4206_01770 [Candidatus Woesearchaeota archaeon]|nr:hypothetical protein [Candidatus Woesearchaeota archaeon]